MRTIATVCSFVLMLSASTSMQQAGRGAAPAGPRAPSNDNIATLLTAGAIRRVERPAECARTIRRQIAERRVAERSEPVRAQRLIEVLIPRLEIDVRRKRLKIPDEERRLVVDLEREGLRVARERAVAAEVHRSDRRSGVGQRRRDEHVAARQREIRRAFRLVERDAGRRSLT